MAAPLGSTTTAQQAHLNTDSVDEDELEGTMPGGQRVVHGNRHHNFFSSSFHAIAAIFTACVVGFTVFSRR